jgi:hypothetical protein
MPPGPPLHPSGQGLPYYLTWNTEGCSIPSSQAARSGGVGTFGEDSRSIRASLLIRVGLLLVLLSIYSGIPKQIVEKPAVTVGPLEKWKTGEQKRGKAVGSNCFLWNSQAQASGNALPQPLHNKIVRVQAK